ncbi:MAG: hypothetical protein EPO68_03840, partial [Planctomycetota bacterium]
KAHPDVFNVLLQILDDGRLTDGKGNVVDFTQTLVLMTSNLRSTEQLREFFRPEFLNRLDEVLVYKKLEQDQIAKIVEVQLRRVAKHLAEQEIGLELTTVAKDKLSAEGWDEEYGARPLKRAIQRRVQNLLAEAILSGKLGRGDLAFVDWRLGNFTLETRAGQAKATSAAGSASATGGASGDARKAAKSKG